MKKQKILIAAAALLAAVGGIVFCMREARVDAVSHRVKGDEPSAALTRRDAASTGARRDAASTGARRDTASTGARRDAASTGASAAARVVAAAGVATNGATRILAPGETRSVASALPTRQKPTKRGTLPYVLTSKTALGQRLRLAVEAMGAKTVSHVSRNSILIEADAATLARIKADSRFGDVAEFAPAEKIQPELAALVDRGAESVEVSIVTLSEADRAFVIETLEAAGGELLTGCLNEGDTVRAKIPAGCVAALAGRGEIRWMETFSYPKLTNDKAVEPAAMNVRAVWDTHGLTGLGQVVSTSDSGIDTGSTNTMHRDLRDRVLEMKVVSKASATDISGHGTHTAGSIVGTGAESDGKIVGTARDAKLYAWFCGASDKESVLTPDTVSLLYTADGRWTNFIHSASWGTSAAGVYDTMCAKHDEFLWKHPEYLPVFSAGNDGSAKTTVNSPAAAKNILAVGATQNLRSGHDGSRPNGDPTKTTSFSSRGPCRDGRVKPDIAAPGAGIVSTRSFMASGTLYGVYETNTNYLYCSGTSMACPLTAGAVALVRQWLVEQKGFEDKDGKRPTAALMKAVIMGGAKGASVPNNEQGWGRVDLAETLFPSGDRAVKLIDRIPFADGWQTNIVIETTSAAPLDIQLVWVDYPGTASGNQSTPRLVNDLDLIVEPYGTDVEGELYYGNGGDEPDTVNNVESVRIESAAPSKYIITIDCPNIKYDHTKGGAAALYIRGAFDPEATPEAPKCVHLEQQGEDYYSLNSALDSVRTDGETVKILRSTRLLKAVSVPTNCTIVTEAAELGSAPLVRCSKKAVFSVPANVTVAIDGVDFTNACPGLVSAGTLQVKGGTTFSALTAVSAEEGGTISLTYVAVAGDAPVLSVASNGVAALSGVTFGGAKADWSVAGNLTLGNIRFAAAQSVNVAHWGNLALQAGVTNLTQITLEGTTKDSLTLAAPLVQSMEITAPNACTNGAVFGTYTDDFPTEEAARLVNALGKDAELGGKANPSDKTLAWAVIEAPAEAAGARVKAVGGEWKHYYGFTAALREALKGDSALMLVKDAALTNAVTLSHDLALLSTNGAVLALSNAAQFAVPADENLVLTNITVCGGEKLLADCAFRVTGGTMTLVDGAVLEGLTNVDPEKTQAHGGAIVVNAGAVTMKSGSLIRNCVACSGGNGGAIWLGGQSATANLFGGTITGCSAAQGGAVFSWGGQSSGGLINVQGDFTATNNTVGSAERPTPGNLYLMRMAPLKLTGRLTGSVGVSFGTKIDHSDLNVTNACFVAADGLAEEVKTASAPCFENDIDENLIGANLLGQIVWRVRPSDDGQCEESVAKVFVTDANGTRHYIDLNTAFAFEKGDATFYLKDSIVLTNDVQISHNVTFEKHPDETKDKPIVWRAKHAMYKVVAGGSLTLSNVKLVGACSWDEDGENPWDDDPWCPFTPLFYEDTDPENPVEEPSIGYGLISVDGGSLTLEDGARVGFVFGNMSRASNAITVFNGGTVTMKSGSRVSQVDNRYTDDYEVSCGGGILLDRSTGYFEGGAIYNCKAYRAGGLYVANESTAYVSGGIYIDDNESWKRQFEQGTNSDLSDNVVVSKNSKLVLAGPLESVSPWSEDPDDPDPGYIGVNESIAGDTNWFGYVSEDWNWDYDTLTSSAAYFRHDKRSNTYWEYPQITICGTAVTNWNEKTQRWDARLVWEDSLSQAKGITIDGVTYRGTVPPGMMVAVPKAFSVAPATGANGKQVLKLEGGVEGCWYTVYSTEDLAQPFTVETSVQLKTGETFEYEVDRTKGAKFYKVVAKEGLK